MLLKDFIKDSRYALEPQYPASEAASLVEILCSEVLGVSRVQHIVEPSYEVSPDKEGTLLSYMDRLVAGEPVQYILGYADFYGRRFNVSPSVLIPRQETELLVHEILAHVKTTSCRILDLCTGSGCIAWTLAAELPGSAVTAVDISPEALEVASSQPIDIPNKPIFIQSDVLDINTLVSKVGPCDVLVSNPPYVREQERAQMRANVLDHEPGLALFVPDEDPLLFYKVIAQIASVLQPSLGIVEINEAFAPEVEALFVAAGYTTVRTVVDFFGKNRHVFFAK